MSGQSRRAICSVLFYAKVFVALAYSLAVMSYLTTLAYQRRESALYENALTQERDRLGLPPPVIAIRPGQCNAVVGSSSVSNGFRISQGHRLEPPLGTTYFGFSLDFSRDTIPALAGRLGKSPAVINTFTTINTTWFDKDQLNWWASDSGRVGAILEVTLDPSEPIGTIPDSIFEEFAAYLRGLNSQYGTPMIIRYGHEMNGYWRGDYGMKPVDYVRTFRVLSNAIKIQTNMTAMLWSPNVGSGYPFGATTSQLPDSGSADFAAMDTNGDGVISVSDDPYLPFYPGDEYVDWVGLSFYQYGINVLTTQDYVNRGLNPSTTLYNFYTRFSDEKGKPMALGESGSPFTASLPTNGNTELAIKQSWWKTLFEVGASSSRALFPNLKFIMQFEESKIETFNDPATGVLSSNVRKDYRISFTDTIRSAFLSDIATYPSFKWSNQLNYTCNGGVTAR